MNFKIAKTLDCPKCLSEMIPNFELNGPHIQATCSVCGKHIKFVSMAEFTPEELEELKRLKKSKPLF